MMSLSCSRRHLKTMVDRSITVAAVRLQSTSTVASSPSFSPKDKSVEQKQDFSTAVASSDAFDAEHWKALVSAATKHEFHQPMTRARTMDLAEAAETFRRYDKILLLVRHGEINQDEEDNTSLMDPLLSGKGVGQVLNISRKTAIFCNEETGFFPESIVTSPLRRAVQTALVIFPQYSPAASLKNISWICHGGLVERPSFTMDVPSSRQDLEREFPGIDFDLYDSCTTNSSVLVPGGFGDMVESKLDLLDRTDDFLQWIKEREERVIVVSSHSTWLQSFCGQTLHYDEDDSAGSEPFQTGEMRAVGINFE